ncbi:response regulator [Sphingomonas qilianensis]|uniref:Response regulator n=1 Tax=Sphingomonas qilianensis TaxID=1736690 RepID=A0ABU9XM67_9SPHN
MAASPPSIDPHRPKVILIDDDEGVRRSLQLLLHWRGFEVRSFGTATPALQDHCPASADILIVDYVLPDGDGIGVLDAFRALGWRGRAILMTALPSSALSQRALASGFDVVLEKPLYHQDLLAAILPRSTP